MAGNLDFRLNLLANTTGLQQGMNGAKFAVNALVTAMAAVGVGVSVNGLATAADSYTNLSARINIATRENGDFQSAMAGVHLVALQTNSSLQATGDLFTRLNTVGKDMGMTQKQALDLTKTVTQAIQIGGGSAQASEAAVTQFIQAMQGGVLRGEEFNSIMENGYGLAEALAKGLGVTTGELRKMAENGELSAERVITAVQKQASEVQKTYDQFPTTIGNALQRITTSWEILIGKMDQLNGASATVAQWLVTLADNIQDLSVFIEDIGDGFVWIGEKLQSIDPAVINTIKETLNGAYEAVKSLIENAGVLGETLRSSFTTALDAVSPLFAALLSGKEEVSGLEVVLNLFRMSLAAVSDVATGFNIGLKLLLSGIQFLSGGLYALNSQVLDFLGFDTLAQQALNASDRMFAQAEKNTNGAIKLAENHKWAVIETYNEIGKTQEQKDAEAVASSKAKLDQLLLDQQTEVNAKKASEEEKLSAVQAYAEATIAANKGVMDGVMQADLMTKGYIVTVDQAGKVSVDAWSKAEMSTEGVAASADKARKAATSLGLDLDIALSRISAKFKESEAQVNSFANNLSALGVEGEKASNVLYQAWSKWLETAKSQTEIDFAKAKLKEFGEQGKLSTSQVEMGMQAIRQVVQKLPADINPVTAAFERLGIKTKEQLALAAQSALADFNTIQSSGQATAESLKQAYERTMQAAAASGDQAVIASTQAKAASLGLQVQVDQTGKATVTSMNDVSSSVDRVGRSFDGLKGHARSAGEVMREEARSSTEEWAAAIEAQKDAMGARTKGTRDRLAYNADMIAEKLKADGYDDERANKIANELWQSSRTADGKAYKQVGNNWSFASGGGGMSNVDYINEQLKRFLGNAPSTKTSIESPSIPNAPIVDSEVSKTVEYKFMSGGKEVSLYGSANDGNAMEALLSEFEMLKRGT